MLYHHQFINLSHYLSKSIVLPKNSVIKSLTHYGIVKILTILQYHLKNHSVLKDVVDILINLELFVMLFKIILFKSFH
ncbi:hypothetical protein KSF78_0001169 [Schistosoma japonicum]|nr:hypothetical protein KSF78_0001169 [Schistosoma japonicum]